MKQATEVNVIGENPRPAAATIAFKPYEVKFVKLNRGE
jgi:hypothetical protein